MRERVWVLANYDHDCTEEESAEIKRLLDDATYEEGEALSRRWPIENAEWAIERAKGYR